ncbi:septum site-determining protein MinC [Streptohalobacillus salinus]|uniref:Probable septum site-determining protein MinC n=1 Tax=Streptohalobacillus salinus TaxID=621096 RepID=A0A2V3W7B1_9BACI|nr:septum site-determining protein MinC [Streptohalobacillus salinus]PXW90022.1 septum site-determining protein MinC [Streptohalobacillus salinus]
MANKKQHITMKGTRDGLSLVLDDRAQFSDVLAELAEILSQKNFDDNQSLVTVKIDLGYRFLHKDEEEQLREMIRSKEKLVVQSIDTKVMTKEEALRLKEENDIHVLSKTVRSGQVIDVTGDLLVFGDINPGGTIKATGNVFVMGALRGIAHAGTSGNKESIIAASLMNPVQLRIAALYSRSPDYETEGVTMECAFIENEMIMIDRIQRVQKKRPELNGFERSVLNG